MQVGLSEELHYIVEGLSFITNMYSDIVGKISIFVAFLLSVCGDWGVSLFFVILS